MPDRTTIIDTHQHAVPDFYVKALESIGENASGERGLPEWTIEQSLDVMDRKGIRATVLSISSPGVYFGDIAFTKPLVTQCNDYMAGLMGNHPGQIGALGQVSLPDVESACRDVEYALDSLKLDGISLLGHIGDQYLGSPDFDEFYAELDKRNAVVFVHPLRPPADGMPEFGFPRGFVELVFDTTRAIGNMLYYGITERFPNIRFVMSHAGGTTPILVTRFRRIENLPTVAERLPGGVVKSLGSLYYDVVQSALPATLRALQDIAASDHVLFGTDYPFSRIGEKVIDETIEGVETFDGYDAEIREKIFQENAVALFPKLAK